MSEWLLGEEDRDEHDDRNKRNRVIQVEWDNAAWSLFGLDKLKTHLSQILSSKVILIPPGLNWINTGHYKNLNTIGKQNYQKPGVEAELNFEFFESYHFIF